MNSEQFKPSKLFHTKVYSVKRVTGSKYILLQALYIFLIFEQAIIFNLQKSAFSSVINYLDDVIVLVFLLICIVLLFRRNRLFKADIMIMVSFLCFVLIGIISTLIYQIQSYFASISDLFLCSRFIISYFTMRLVFNKKDCKSIIYINFNAISRLVALLFFVLSIHECIFHPFFQQFDVRFGIHSIALFYPHPTYLAAACVIMLCVLTVSLDITKSNWVYIIMLSIVITLTFRTKAIAFLAIYFLLYIFLIKFHFKSKMVLIISSIGLALFVGFTQITTYFLTSGYSPRELMLIDSITLAKQYFPFGTGFATFGSHMAQINYSPLYYMFHYSFLYGMSPSMPLFLEDGFWQIVIGQFGFVGLILFIIVILGFFVIIFKLQKRNIYLYISALSLLIYIIVTSTSETSFFNPYSITFFMVLGIMLCYKNDYSKSDGGDS